jgi:hypothetical protein
MELTAMVSKISNMKLNIKNKSWFQALITFVALLIIWVFALRNAFDNDRLFALTEDNEFLLGSLFSGISHLYFNGSMPLRLDTILGGLPLYNSTQLTPFYPFYFFFLDIYDGYLNTLKTMHWLTLLHLLLLLVNMYILLRTMGVNRIAAITGAALFTFSADMYVYAIWVNIVTPYSWLPLYIAGILGVLQNKAIRKSFLIAFMSMLMIVSSSPSQPLIHAVLLTLFISIGYIIHCFRLKRQEQLIKPLLVLGITSILCFLLCAPILLSAQLESSKMIRWIGNFPPILMSDKMPFDAYVFYRFPLIDFWQLFFHKTMVMVGGAYVGFFAIPLAMLAFCKKGNWLATVFFSVAVYALLSSFGDDLGMAYINYKLPLLDKIREPSRFLVLFQLSMATLVSMGLFNLSQDFKEDKSVNVRARYLLCVAAVIVTIAFVFGNYQFSSAKLVANAFGSYKFKIDASDNIRFFICLLLIISTLYLLKQGSVFFRKLIVPMWSIATLVSLFTVVNWQPLLTIGTSVYVQKDYAALDMAIAHVAETDPNSNFRLIFDGSFDKGQASMLASYRGVRTFNFYMNPAPIHQTVDFSYEYSPYYTYEGAAFLICKQCNISGYPSFKFLKKYGDYTIYFDDNAYPRFFLGRLAGFFKDTPDFVSKVQGTPSTDELNRNVYLETGTPIGDLKIYTSKPLPYKAENYNDKNWINGVANQWATAFFVKASKKAKLDFKVGRKVSFFDGTTRIITEQKENADALTVFLDGEPLDGNKLGYPKDITISEEIFYKADNNTDKNWINGVANKWATAFLVKVSNTAKTDLAVGKKIAFSDGTIRTIIKHQENENSLIVFLDGEPLDGNKLGYPNAIKVIESNTHTRTDCNLLTLFSSATRHELLVDCDAEHILVLNEYHDGNWRGYINGVKTNILKVNGNQNGIMLTANSKFLTFEYRPSIFFKSLTFSLLGFILFILVYFLVIKTNFFTHEQE